MVSMFFWQLYLCGAVVSAIVASVAVDWFGERDEPRDEPLVRAAVIVLAGVLWPILLVGLMQLSLVAGLARAMRTTPVGQPDEVPPKRRTARN
jgi:biotin transporter BioY